MFLLASEAMALLDNLRYDGGASATLSNAFEDASAEGKFGIPRFNGDPSALQEYLYRVRARAAREALMDPAEIKKIGPLGLRLLEGLRGSAFKIAQQVNIEELGKKEGHEQLLSLLERSLKPRKDLEARELYAAGSRDGGILSRQPGEAMSSYVMRRRAWWGYLQQLDDSLQVSENILSEQMLQNSGLTDDQKLMIRTTLHGKLTVDKVANELLNQHPRIQDREKGHHRKPFHHFAKDYKRDWKGRNGKGYSRSYAAIDDDETATPWDVQSQSLAGFTEDLGDVECDDEDETYFSVTEDADHFMTEYMGWYVEEGLDLESEEACALAAEALQLEYEAYSVRCHAKGKGHGGFAGQRHFEVSGSLSLQEKRARLQQLKLKTECRKCGQKGHWSGDKECPKGAGKGKRFGTPSTTSTSASSKGKKGKGGSPKTRVVYSAMHEDENVSQDQNEDICNMAVHVGSTPPRPTSRASTGPTSSTSLAPMPMPGTPQRNAEATQQMVQSLFDRGWTADQVLELMLSVPGPPQSLPALDQARGPLHPAHHELPELSDNTGPMSQPQLSVPLTVVDQVLSTLQDMDVEESGFAELPPLPGSQAAPSSVDTNVTNAPSTPEPNLRHHERTTARGTNGYYRIVTCLDCNQVIQREKKTGVSAFNPSAEGHTKKPAFCRHHRVTWRGSNGINWRNTCLDCGKVTKGRWDDKTFPGTGVRPPLPADRDFLLGAIGQPVTENKQYNLNTIQEIVRSAVIVAAIRAKENNGTLGLEELRRIIDATAVNINLFSPQPEASATPAAELPRHHQGHRARIP